MIKKVGKKFVLYSKSKKGGKRRRLGTFGSRAAAMKREKQIQYFKSLNENSAGGNSASAVQGAVGSFKVGSAGIVGRSGSQARAKRIKGQGNKQPKVKMASLVEKNKNLYQEQVLREAIRKIISLSKIKYFEEQGQKALEEQKLRRVVRTLISEKAELTPFRNTGLNTAVDVLKRIRRTIVDSYKNLTSSKDQRKDYIDTVETLLLQAIKQQDDMKNIESGGTVTAGAPVAGTEELEEQDLDPGSSEMPITAALEDSGSEEEKAKKKIKQITADISSAEIDTTGGIQGKDDVGTIAPQVLQARDSLKDEDDIKAFDLAILGGNGKIGNIKAFANIAEKELQATLGASGGSLDNELSTDSQGNPAQAEPTGEQPVAEEPPAEEPVAEEPPEEEIV